MYLSYEQLKLYYDIIIKPIDVELKVVKQEFWRQRNIFN